MLQGQLSKLMSDIDRFFFPLWWKLLARDFKEGHYASLFPWKLSICILLGFFALGSVDVENNTDKILVVYSALLTAAGILTAITSTSIQQTLSIISSPGFSSYLDDNDILPYYLFFIMYFQTAMILSLLIISLSIFVMLSVEIKSIRYVSLALGLSCFLYSLIQTFSSTILTRDLIYYRSKFDRIYKISI